MDSNQNNKEFLTHLPVRHLGQLNETVGDNVELHCKHKSCDLCSGTGFIGGQNRCPNSIACNCPLCLGLGH